MSRPRNQYLGSYDTRPAHPIDLPFTVENLRALLDAGARGSGDPTHQQIADWADRYVTDLFISDRPETAGVSADDPDIDVAMDIAVQWDLLLLNTYSLSELQAMDFAEEAMPTSWFEKWSVRLSAGVS